MSTCYVYHEHPAADADVRAVISGLVHYNDRHAEPERGEPLTLFLRDDTRALRGGLLGSTQWRWMYVSHLWVDEKLRGCGHGRALLLRAEKEALSRGCLHAHLDTFGFQARRFYERLGYRVFGALDDYPPGHTRYYLHKPLLVDGAQQGSV